MPAVTRPVVEDLIGWLRLQTEPSEEALVVYSEALEAALVSVEDRINLPDGTSDEDYPPLVRLAVLLTANRLAKRSDTPEGVAGFGELGNVVRIMPADPDVERLLARYLKLDGFH